MERRGVGEGGAEEAWRRRRGVGGSGEAAGRVGVLGAEEEVGLSLAGEEHGSRGCRGEHGGEDSEEALVGDVIGGVGLGLLVRDMVWRGVSVFFLFLFLPFQHFLRAFFCAALSFLRETKARLYVEPKLHGHAWFGVNIG